MPTVTKILPQYGVKFGQLLEWSKAKLKIAIYSVSFGSAETYATGGISVSFPDISRVLGAVKIGGGLNDYHVVYNVSTGKIQVFGQTPTSESTGVIALAEIANGSGEISSTTLYFLVIGI